MTTQKITATLRTSGFTAFYEVSERIDGIRKQVRKGDYTCFKCGKLIGIETRKVAEIMEALASKGIASVETRSGSGMIKIL